MNNKIILVGKLVTDNNTEIADGYAQVEFEVDKLLDKIDSCDVRSYAKDNFDLIPIDELDDVDEDDLVSELEDRNYNFIKGASVESLIDRLDYHGYKAISNYDAKYHGFFNFLNLDNIDMILLKEITKRFVDASILERSEIHKEIMNRPY